MATQKVVEWILLSTDDKKRDQTFKSSPSFQRQKRSQICRVFHSHQLLFLAVGQTWVQLAVDN